MQLTLTDIAAVLGCAKPTASQLRSGTYAAPEASLARQYRALADLVARIEREAQASGHGAICRDCPREECAGCRIAELI